jgi:fermentation-respiration switch protein FrsA (DUF1100 family)
MLGTLFAMLAVPALFAGWFYLMQPAMIFLPYGQLEATPGDWGLAYEDVWLQASDGVRLHAWYLPREASRRTVLFLHGNAGNISHRQASLEIFHRLGLNVLIVDYRGYGRSEGRPSEVGLYRDAAAAWEYLMQRRGVAAGDIVLFGRSLGGAVAAHLAAEVQPGAVILESTFSSARDFVQELYPLLSWLIVRRFEFDSAARMQAVNSPVMVLHSPEDEIMPFSLGQKLYEAATEPKVFHALRGDHNTGFLLSQPQYEQAIAEFLATHLD